MTDSTRTFWAVIYTELPETRWVYRHILRRTTRRYVLHAGLLDSLDITRAINSPDKCSFTLNDPMECLFNA